MAYFKKRNRSVNSQIVLAFVTLTSLIILVELFAYQFNRQMLFVNSLRESFWQLKELQLQMKGASNEFILRERTNPLFFASGKSVFLDRYSNSLKELRSKTKEIKINGESLSVIDSAEIDRLEKAIEQYNEVFLKMSAHIKMRGYAQYGLIGDFDKSIESLLGYDFLTDKAAVLNLQLFVKNYLLTGDEQLTNNISNEIYRFTMVLEKHVRDEDVGRVASILVHYEEIFKKLTLVDKELGIYTGEGLQRDLFSALDRLDAAIQLKKINEKINEVYSNALSKLYFSFVLVVLVAICAAFVINAKLNKSLVVPIQEMKVVIARMSRGEVPKSILRFKVDDLNEMAKALNNLVTGTRNYQDFANHIGRGNLDTSFVPLSEQDILGNSLLAMRDNLKAHISNQYSQMLELTRLNSELDNFTYHASHDLRAPLTTILGLVNLGLKETSIDETHSYFRMIQNRVDHMDTLLKDLISISFNHKTEASYLEFDFEKEIKEIVGSLQTPGHSFDIRQDIQQPCSMVSDPVRLRTILGNLLSNAFKYYNPEAKLHLIELRIFVDHGQASILINDNGIGIHSLHKEKIFEMFFRATTRSTGTGLGLYIVKSMIDRLGGQISFESTLNRGTCFQLVIPNQRAKRKLDIASVEKLVTSQRFS